MQYFSGTNINFVGKRQIFFFVSIFVILGGLIASFVLKPVYGIDFEGGTEIAVRFDRDVQPEELRALLNKQGVDGAEIKSFGKENQYLIRIKESKDAINQVYEALGNNFSEFNVENNILKVDKIGPKIGSELRGQAFIAIFLSVLAILIYIAFRFEFTFGLGAIVALVHDVVVTFSLIVIFHHLGIVNLEINQTILAAMLTVVGFSINDTVIIFDRIRENRERQKGLHFEKMVNLSINETLSRTINTVFTALLVLVTIVLFGGPVLQGFAFTMLLGIITGTYSSIYIASSFVIWYLEKVKKVDLQKGLVKKKSVLGN